ncbi:hypothetical protein C8Q70DRAFT_884152, partial [Cubamyces menziesii]
LYHDRRFQHDRYFPFMAFKHEQMHGCTTGGYLLTKCSNFKAVADKILSIDMDALKRLIDRGSSGQFSHIDDPEERKCLELMSLINYVSTRVPGSVAHRRFQRNEIKSLIIAFGVPIFFITFAPADFKNPLCLYYCGQEIDLSKSIPDIPPCRERLKAISRNPVGCARFFDFTVRTFIQYILRVEDPLGRDGLFGQTSAYYGTVE